MNTLILKRLGIGIRPTVGLVEIQDPDQVEMFIMGGQTISRFRTDNDGFSIGSLVSKPVQVMTAGVPRLTIDSFGRSTFAGELNVQGRMQVGPDAQALRTYILTGAAGPSPAKIGDSITLSPWDVNSAYHVEVRYVFALGAGAGVRRFVVIGFTSMDTPLIQEIGDGDTWADPSTPGPDILVQPEPNYQFSVYASRGSAPAQNCTASVTVLRSV